MQGAWKVGLLVVVFVAMLYAGYLLLGASLISPKTDLYFADFADAGGIGVGTPVLMAGVKIGQVQKIELSNPKVARISLGIDRQYQIPAGSVAQVEGSLIGLGQQPVTIVPPDHLTGMNLQPHSILRGAHTSPVDNYLPGAKDTMVELKNTLVAARGLLQDEHLRGDITKVLETSAATLEKFGTVADRANALIGQNQASINRAIASASMAMANIQKSTAIVAEFAKDPRWRQQSMAILDNLASTSKRAEKLVDNLNSFVTDPKLRQPMNETLANTAKITDTGTRIADNTEIITKNGITMSQKAIEIEDKAKGLEDDAKGVLNHLNSVFGPHHVAPLLSGVTANVDLIRESHPGHTRTDVNASVPVGKGTSLHVGVYDAFESNKLNLELGHTFSPGSEFLYGVYASKPGVGVDYRIAPWLYFRGDFYDPNAPRADLRARILFGKGFYGWLGINGAFKNNAPMIGLGFQK
jgi:phospholipid/cholesterol/gamma-HCH transport system substrate-binding protein